MHTRKVRRKRFRAGADTLCSISWARIGSNDDDPEKENRSVGFGCFLATATCGIGPRAGAAPHCDMEHTRVGLDGVLYCVEYEGGAGVSVPEVPADFISLTEFLDDMEEGLADSMAQTGALALEVGEPFYLVARPQMEASSVVSVYDPFGGLATGFSDVKAYSNSGDVAFNLELTEGEITRIRMALPSILSLAGARIPWAHAAVFSDLHRA